MPTPMVWTREVQSPDGMVWYRCANTLGEDTIISCEKNLRVNDSSNQGHYFLSFNGDMAQTRFGIRTWKSLDAVKAVAERLIRKGRKLGTHS